MDLASLWHISIPFWVMFSFTSYSVTSIHYRRCATSAGWILKRSGSPIVLVFWIIICYLRRRNSCCLVLALLKTSQSNMRCLRLDADTKALWEPQVTENLDCKYFVVSFSFSGKTHFLQFYAWCHLKGASFFATVNNLAPSFLAAIATRSLTHALPAP